MRSIKKEWLIAASIPIIFSVGVVGFFTLLSPESRTLSNLINYTSSLSAIVMVLVVIFTTWLQLREMESTRTLQAQPFPFMRPLKKSYLEKPRIFYSPPEKESALLCRMFFYISVENIGSGPAVAIDVIPKLMYKDKNGKLITIEPVNSRIDSLKQNEKDEIEIMFTPHLTRNADMHECIMRSFISPKGVLPYVKLKVFYKNVLGANFREQELFEIWPYEGDDEKIKTCLKLLETTKIDYADEMRKIKTLAKDDREAKHELIGKLNRELSKKEGCSQIELWAEPIRGSFSVKPVSEKDYQKEMEDKSYGHRVMPPKKISEKQSD